MKLETRIMAEIKDKKIKMKPKWWFMVLKDGERGILGLLMLGAALVLAGVIYTIDLMGVGELWSIGSIGREVMLDSLPYKMILLSLGVLGASGVFYAKTGDNFKKSTKVLVIRVAAVIGLITVLMTMARMVLEKGWGL